MITRVYLRDSSFHLYWLCWFKVPIWLCDLNHYTPGRRVVSEKCQISFFDMGLGIFGSKIELKNGFIFSNVLATVVCWHYTWLVSCLLVHISWVWCGPQWLSLTYSWTRNTRTQWSCSSCCVIACKTHERTFHTLDERKLFLWFLRGTFLEHSRPQIRMAEPIPISPHAPSSGETDSGPAPYDTRLESRQKPLQWDYWFYWQDPVVCIFVWSIFSFQMLSISLTKIVRDTDLATMFSKCVVYAWAQWKARPVWSYIVHCLNISSDQFKERDKMAIYPPAVADKSPVTQCIHFSGDKIHMRWFRWNYCRPLQLLQNQRHFSSSCIWLRHLPEHWLNSETSGNHSRVEEHGMHCISSLPTHLVYRLTFFSVTIPNFKSSIVFRKSRAIWLLAVNTIITLIQTYLTVETKFGGTNNILMNYIQLP